MFLVSIFKKVKYFSILMLFFVFISSCSFTYATVLGNTHNDLTKDLSSSEEEEIFEYDALTKIIKDIFSFDRERGDASVNNIGNLLYDLIDTGLQKFSDISDTTIYKYVQGVAIMFLMINFLIKVYQEFDTGLDEEVFTKEFIRECIVLIIALIAILILKYFVIFIFSFFRFLMDKMLYISSNNELGSVTDISNNVKSDRIAYEILRESGLVGRGSLVEEISKRSKEASLRSMYMIPWVSTWICKVGELIVVFVNSILLIVYSIFICISVSDIVVDIKNSKFITYVKYFVSIAIQEVIIIIVIYIGELILNPYIQKILINLNNGTSNLSFINAAIIITAIEFTKLIVLISTFSLSKKLMGVV